MRLRVRCLAVLLALTAAACVGAPPHVPGPDASATTPGRVLPSPSREPPPIRFTVPALRAAVTRDGLAAHLRGLAGIARANGGQRSSGTPGYAASVAYTAAVFREAGFRVRLQRFQMPVFEVLEPARLDGAGFTLSDGRDFRAALHSASGDVSGTLVHAGTGCSSSEFGSAALPGGVALVRYGSCGTSSKVRNAQAAGAAAVLVVRTDSVPGSPIRPTLGSPDGISVPVLALTPDAGDAASRALGSTVRVAVSARSPIATTSNVIAEIGPRSGPVVMAGGHLDSVIDGPGINDNGSGVAAVLALAEALGRVRKPPRIRLALWGGEEYFLIGSTTYVEGLDDAARSEISAYLNLDMVGSPNAVHLVYDADPDVRDALVAGLRGLPYELEPMQNNSDHAPFEDAGIDVGGIFTGALEPLSDTQAARYGGVAGEPADACYHQACDDIGNVNPTLAARIADALAEAVVVLSGG